MVRGLCVVLSTQKILGVPMGTVDLWCMEPEMAAVLYTLLPRGENVYRSLDADSLTTC